MIRTALFLLILIPLFWCTSAARAAAQDSNTQINQRSQRADAAFDEIVKKQAKAANQKRQADLKRDTDRLLELATELKTQVDKTNENILSLNVIKKAEEIEKLAHSVKQKMKAAGYAEVQ